MPSETIWSNSSDPASPRVTSKFRSVFDQVDSNTGSMESRRFSFQETSELESNLFDFKNSLSQVPYAASTGGPHAPVTFATSKNAPIQLGTASISGGIANIHPPKDSFLQKFSSVADATRDIELSNSIATLSLDGGARRTSFNYENNVPSLNVSPHGSMNENLNIASSRGSRHQSISEKIDNFNNNSPIQTPAVLSSDLNNPGNNASGADASKAASKHPQSFWNPATATSFTPAATFNYFLENSPFPHVGAPIPPNPYPKSGPMMPPIHTPPFMMGNFMEGGVSNMMSGTEGTPESDSTSVSGVSETKKPTEPVQEGAPVTGSKSPTRNAGIPGIGLMSRQPHPSAAGYVFHPFSPYSMYTPTPQGVSPPPPPIEVRADGGSSAQGFVPPLSGQPHHGKRGKTGRGGHNGGKSSHHIYRSPLLEEVRSNPKSKEFYLKDIHGHVVEFTKDQHGSRFIQQKLPSATAEEKEMVFSEIQDISYDLMTDVFGNYVIQKFFEFGSDSQRQILLGYMKGNIHELSLQMYGCRVVQRALEAIPLEDQIEIVEELKDHVLSCAKDQNGNHVIQKSIEKIPFENVRFILDSLDSHIYHLSTHPYGCRVIQRLLEYSDIEDQQHILAELNRFLFYLIQDQYGNYVIQHILERGTPSEKEEIFEVAFSSIVNFSKHKFASNVIEKCIKHGTLEQRKRIWREVMLGNEDLEKETVADDSPLALMMKDQYANYVIQKLVECFHAKSKEKKDLVVKLRQYLKQLSMKNSYGKHLASVEKMIAVAETALVEADRS
ncbi:Pumilio-family RNA binding repeat protein [Clavispora lusitaniae]|uniref:Pumilio homology domain family member 3 n=1 Tax=Clavispora lusitaniae (strain ATCC 42720) TaxID=306902 RepID=C4Y8H4_CLAL4|nr:uncharacterized protein CLUG_04502 [Clavispora lusitaniae ATCC 42720]EEQ40374.1 hypothetical protein CLUG_04502 [Clavispora lusitaniae ATCC 42720]KAF5209660.1 mRNA binding protein puf3 [Clavispora lusitaniae]KAF7581687.1 Pumilio-family RNA binding repeat protein [Clavispora lusitaniae]